VAFADKSGQKGDKKYWNEACVSEDFDLMLRFTAQNMYGRYIMYTGDGFEGALLVQVLQSGCRAGF
jgi:hypothetical protein